jgi:alpha-1,6-mannosyltransferase
VGSTGWNYRSTARITLFSGFKKTFMKIVDVAEFYSERGGGVRTYILQKLEASAREGHEMVIIAPGPEDREELRAGGKIIWVQAPRLILDPRYHIFVSHKGIHAALDREQPDVIEGSSPWVGGRAAASWPGSAVRSFFIHQDPVAAYPHTLLGGVMGAHRVDRLFGWFWAYLRRLSARFDTTVVSGEWLANRMESFGLRRPQAIPFGIPPGIFSPSLRDRQMRRRMLAACGIDDESATLFVTVGRHHPEKRLGTLIKAIGRIRAEKPVGLYMIGDGPMRGWIERKARGVKGVHVAGAITGRQEYAIYLASADAFIHGCGIETFGLAIAEAICSGLPLIVPDTGGAADLASPAYAETYLAGDAKDATAAIRRFLARDRDGMRAQAALAAKSRVRSSEDHFRDLFTHYKTLVEKAHKLAAKPAHGVPAELYGNPVPPRP